MNVAVAHTTPEVYIEEEATGNDQGTGFSAVLAFDAYTVSDM